VTFQELVDEVRKAAQCDDGTVPVPVGQIHINPETYRMWKANSGNAKARRRWRRRNVPNTQKLRHAEDVIWRERVEPMQRVPPVALGPDSPSLVGAMRYMVESLRGAR
jgi:hypothetical protein